MSRPATGKLLIIDDDRSFGAIIKAYAEQRGFETVFCTSLLELGSFARIREFDIAMIDYYLGNLRGDEIAEYVDTFFREIPVVIVSSESFKSEQVAKWPQSVRRFLAKSLGAPKIVEETAKVLGRERFLRHLERRPAETTRPNA